VQVHVEKLAGALSQLEQRMLDAEQHVRTPSGIVHSQQGQDLQSTVSAASPPEWTAPNLQNRVSAASSTEVMSASVQSMVARRAAQAASTMSAASSPEVMNMVARRAARAALTAAVQRRSNQAAELVQQSFQASTIHAYNSPPASRDASFTPGSDTDASLDAMGSRHRFDLDGALLAAADPRVAAALQGGLQPWQLSTSTLTIQDRIPEPPGRELESPGSCLQGGGSIHCTPYANSLSQLRYTGGVCQFPQRPFDTGSHGHLEQGVVPSAGLQRSSPASMSRCGDVDARML